MPAFYLVPYPTPHGSEILETRRSTTKECSKLYKACQNGRIKLETYRWGLYLFGGESQVSIRNNTGEYFGAILAQCEDRDAFRAAMMEAGYTDLTGRAVEYNVYAPLDLFDRYPCGKQITISEARTYLEKFPIPLWINRDAIIYRGWKLNPENWRGQKTLADLEGTVIEGESNQAPDSIIRTMPTRNASPTTIHGPLEMHGKNGESAAKPTGFSPGLSDGDGLTKPQSPTSIPEDIWTAMHTCVNTNRNDTDEEGLTNPQAPPYTLEDTRPTERTRVKPHEDDIYEQQATSAKGMAFFRTLAQASGNLFNQPHTTSLSSDCPIVKAIREGSLIIGDHNLVFETEDGFDDVQLTILYDNDLTAVMVPTATAKYVIELIAFVQGFYINNRTTAMSVEFILRHVVRVKQDFGLTRLIYKTPANDQDNYRPDLASTMMAWEREHGAKITHTSVEEFKARLIAMRRYLEKHGVVEGVVLRNGELSRLAQLVTEADKEEVFGQIGTRPTLMEELMER